MKKLSCFLTWSALCLLLVSCNTVNEEKVSGQNEPEALAFDKQSATQFIDSMNAKFSEQVAAGDSLSLASHYWPDAELLMDNSEVIKGNEILAAWSSFIRSGLKEMSFSTTDITGTSTFIIETGNYEMKGENKAVLDKGKYVVIWEKRGNEWKLYRDIGCTSLPLPK
jgi:ketosteroid isomerase-like protein